MPGFGVAIVWMILAPIAVVLDIMAVLFIQHYRPLYHSMDVALTSLLVVMALTAYFLIPIPAVLELGGLDWNDESCNFYTWLSITLRLSHVFGIVMLNCYWVTALRSKPSHGHMFMSSMRMKICVLVSWFISVIIGLAPVTGGTQLFDFYVKTDNSCHFSPSSISTGFGILIIVCCLFSVVIGIASSADTLQIFRSMKQVALTKYDAGRFHMPSGSGMAKPTPNIHAAYSDLGVATELCRLALCITIVSTFFNIMPFVAMQFMLLVSQENRGTFEDVSLWLQLAEAFLLPNLMWMLSNRYRHAVTYAWKVYVMKDNSAKEEDASACTLQSYKVRALEQQSKATINGHLKKIQANGNIESPPNQTLMIGNQKMSANKVSPIGQRVNEGDCACSSTSDSVVVTDLDDGMTVLSALPQQQMAADSNGVNTHLNHQQLSNGKINSAESHQNNVYTHMAQKTKPPRKDLKVSVVKVPMVAVADVSETVSDVESPKEIPSTMSSPTKSLISTPQRTVTDVERAQSACSRREWKEKMRKKHLPAIFVNNSVDDDKDVKTDNANDSKHDDEQNGNDQESFEMLEIKVLDSDESKFDTEIVAESKQQTYSEDNFYVSSEFHYNFINETYPRKLSLRTQGTMDSDGVSNMYESDDIDNILDLSIASDSVHHTATAVVASKNDDERRENVDPTNIDKLSLNSQNKDKDKDVSYGDLEYVQVIYNHIDTQKNKNKTSANHNASNESEQLEQNLVIKSSLEEFEDNERKLMLSESIESEMNEYTINVESKEIEQMKRDGVLSELKVIDLEASNDKGVIPITARSVTENEEDMTNVSKDNGELLAISQDYNQLETVSGVELIQLKQQTVTSVKTAQEIIYDSSSDDGGIDNDGFEHDSGEVNGYSSFENATNTIKLNPKRTESVVNSDVPSPSQDVSERFVPGEESFTVTQNGREDKHNDNVGTDLSHKNENNLSTDTEVESIEGNSHLKQKKLETNPFLRESFEVLVQSPEYQQKTIAKDSPLFISVKPLPLPRQNTLESESPPISSSEYKKEDYKKHNKSKPPIASKPRSTSLEKRIKTKQASETKSAAKPPVPIRRPLLLKKQSTLGKTIEIREVETEIRLNRPRTSSSDELEKIFDTKQGDALGEDPSFPGEDPPLSTVTNSEPESPVFYSMSPTIDTSFSKQSGLISNTVIDDSVVIEPYGQRRPPWLDEPVDSDLNNSDELCNTIPTNVYSESLSRPLLVNGQNIEEYDLDSVPIRGVLETRNSYSGGKSNTGSSNFYSNSSSSDSSKITPVSEEEKPTFQFYQFDDDIDKGFEDALSVDYITHSNIYSNFGLCFESIKEEPEDSLSESTSSFDGLGDSNSSAVFKTQAIVSRPSSRASVNSSSNGETRSNNNVPIQLSVLPMNDHDSSFEQAWLSNFDNESYENFASPNDQSFITSERTSGDGREEIVLHSNGSTSHHTNNQVFLKIDNSTDADMVSGGDPWLSGGQNSSSVLSTDKKIDTSPWLDVKGPGLDMSFDSDFSQHNENDNEMGNSVQFNDKKMRTNGIIEMNGFSGSKTSNGGDKVHPNTSHVAPVYF